MLSLHEAQCLHREAIADVDELLLHASHVAERLAAVDEEVEVLLKVFAEVDLAERRSL